MGEFLTARRSLIVALFDAAAQVMDAADAAPEAVADLPAEAVEFLCRAEPAIRSLLSTPLQLRLWPDAPVLGDQVRQVSGSV